LKVLAAEADARWAAKPSFLDAPGQARGQPLPSLEIKDPGRHTTLTGLQNKAGVITAIAEEQDNGAKRRSISAGSEETGEQENKMQVPDGRRHDFVKRPGQETRSKEGPQKDKEDPWKQARGGEKWQPAAWDGNKAIRR
jgi:NADH dehydrogenase [ubiquinone] 1 alpha subcomplex assembly factor 2